MSPAKPEKEIPKPKTVKCLTQDGADLELADTVPAIYGGKSGVAKVFICPKCGNVQTFFTVPKKKEKS